jgi:2-keto-myo-inositol isomerase
MEPEMTRRDWLKGASTALGAGLTTATAAAEEQAPTEPFLYSLNTSTIRGQELTVPREIDLAARAGYQAIEPWVPKLEQFVKGGGDPKDLGKRAADAGLRVESSIGFIEWIVDDEGRRRKGLEDARRAFDLVAQLGAKRLAAPPVGATKQTDLNLLRAAERYRALLELGDQFGVVPQVEVWGFSTSLGRLGETALVAIESGHPKACVLADVYHLHKGGSGFGGLKQLSGASLQIFHMNDYPSTPGRDKITDADRVYPGDGVAPLKQMLRDLYRAGFRGTLSLELFNPSYWKQDALLVARTGLEKMKAVVRASMAEE